MKDKDYQVVDFPKIRRFALDAGYLGRRSHIIHGLIEADVTVARQFIRQYRIDTGKSLSFTAFMINCLAKAIESHRVLHAYLNWRKQLIIYNDINVTTMIEMDVDGHRVPMPYIIQEANRKSCFAIHHEIRNVQSQHNRSREMKLLRWFLVLPAVVRRLFYWVVLRIPQLFRSQSSPVLVTAVGMFGEGTGWGIPMANFTLTLTLGGISEKPVVRKGKIVVREILNLTVSIDHDIVDGAPAARFVNELKCLIEEGYGLKQGTENHIANC